MIVSDKGTEYGLEFYLPKSIDVMVWMFSTQPGSLMCRR
jgi:hypothetical protein